MQSKIAGAIGLKTNPVVLTWADSAPDSAIRFKPGAWGCVISLIAGVAAKGKVVAFDRNSYGCWGAGVGLGFGNQYETFPGGMECFCRFLSDGNESDPIGKHIGDQMAKGGGMRFADDFLLGERYLKDAQRTRQFVDSMPMRDIGEKFVVFKPLDQLDPTHDDAKNVTFFVEPDALSALVVLANYNRPQVENVGIPWAAGCQVIGIYSLRELEREHPRALIGMADLSARKNVRASLGEHIMSFTVPWPLFLEMENNVEGSFLQRETWHSLGH